MFKELAHKNLYKFRDVPASIDDYVMFYIDVMNDCMYNNVYGENNILNYDFGKYKTVFFIIKVFCTFIIKQVLKLICN